MRFRVPVRSIHTGPNPGYSDTGRGVTCRRHPFYNCGSRREQLDLALWARRVRQPGVRGEQDDVEHFREGDVGGVVDRQVLAELPAASQQGPVRSPAQRQLDEIGEGQARSSHIEVPRPGPAADNRDRFQVDQLGGRKRLPA